jgi:hypothetical protein
LADVLANAKHAERLRPYWQVVKKKSAAKPTVFYLDELLTGKIVRRQRLTAAQG